MNYDLYPDEDFQKKWLRHYLNKRRQLLEGKELGGMGREVRSWVGWGRGEKLGRW